MRTNETNIIMHSRAEISDSYVNFMVQSPLTPNHLFLLGTFNGTAGMIRVGKYNLYRDAQIELPDIDEINAYYLN